MEEGERLSKKQLAQESTIKKLRAELAEVRSEKGSASASLAVERQKVRPLTSQLQCAHPHKVKDVRSDLQGLAKCSVHTLTSKRHALRSVSGLKQRGAQGRPAECFLLTLLILHVLGLQVEATQASKQRAEEQVAALKQSHKAEVEAEKSHYEALLQKARSAQVSKNEINCSSLLPAVGRSSGRSHCAQSGDSYMQDWQCCGA